MTRDWPHFPEDQLPLFDLPQPDQPREREDLTKGGRVTEREQIADRRIPCRICGSLKTAGLPCPECVERDRSMDAR
jgi:hypothetical protein